MDLRTISLNIFAVEKKNLRNVNKRNIRDLQHIIWRSPGPGMMAPRVSKRVTRPQPMRGSGSHSRILDS